MAILQSQSLTLFFNRKMSQSEKGDNEGVVNLSYTPNEDNFAQPPPYSSTGKLFFVDIHVQSYMVNIYRRGGHGTGKESILRLSVIQCD